MTLLEHMVYFWNDYMVDLKVSEYAKLDNVMWILRKNHECLSKKDRIALELLYKHPPKLKAALR